MSNVVPLDEALYAHDIGYEPPGLPVAKSVPKFAIERWRDINFEANGEWTIKRFLPRRGLAVIYGKPGSFKSFIAVHIALCCRARPLLGWKTCHRRGDCLHRR